MSLSIGIVGLPNVGKSTLFNALLKKQVALSANYPFATIDPNTGVVPVPDDRLAVLADIVKTPNIKPAVVEFVDIAGLVKGASQGEGLGNQFLSHIREVDLICHVVRSFSDVDIIREGSLDPESDKDTIQTELLLADLSTLEKQKEPKGISDKVVQEKWQATQRLLEFAKEGRQLHELTSSDDICDKVAKELNLLTSKPVIYVLNVGEDQLVDLPNNTNSSYTIAISAKIESQLCDLDEEERLLFLSELGLDKSGLERLIRLAYSHLGLQSFLTAGEKEVRAWTVKKGTLAPEASGVIHTDFIKKFIKANVITYEDFVTYKGWKNARQLGKVRIEGKDYPIQEGDVVEFMIGG